MGHPSVYFERAAWFLKNFAAKFSGFLTAVDQLERVILTLLVTAMVVLAAIQILLRNIFKTGFLWAEPLLGMGLLWLTMLGALAAAGQGRHIAIDLVSALLPSRCTAWIGRATSIFAAIVCGILAQAAGHYVELQRELAMGELLGRPLWMFHMVIPIAFWLMSIRVGLKAILPQTWLPRIDNGEISGEGRSSP